MSPFPTRDRKRGPRTVPAEAPETQVTHEVASTGVEFQPESGALGPREPIAEEQLDHDRPRIGPRRCRRNSEPENQGRKAPIPAV